MLGGIHTGGTEAGVGDRVKGWDMGVWDANVESSLSGNSSYVMQWGAL